MRRKSPLEPGFTSSGTLALANHTSALVASLVSALLDLTTDFVSWAWMTAQLNNKQATVSQRLMDMAKLLGNEQLVIGVHCSRTHIVQVFEGLDASVVSQFA